LLLASFCVLVGGGRAPGHGLNRASLEGTALAGDGFCGKIDGDPAEARRLLSLLARSLTGAPPGESPDALADWRRCTRERSRDLGRKGSWAPAEAEALAALLLIDPERFATEAPFRRKVLPLLPEALDAGAPPALRDDLLAELNQVRGFDFEASDRLEVAWKRVPRLAAERKLGFPAAPPTRSGLRFDPDTSGRILASFYSLPARFFEAGEARAFLAAVAALAPDRDVLVFSDLAQSRALEASRLPGKVRLLPTFGRSYTPWPRDPFTLARTASGRVVALARPNLQPGREEDGNLAAELVQDLPDDLDRGWGGTEGVGWTVAPTPFHNGQVLLTEDAAWMTIHALEPRVLALLGTDRVPVESFGSAAGIDRYLRAVDQAAGELAALYGRPVRFVHPLPHGGALAERTALLRTLGGAAGYDLDSLVTLVSGKQGRAALVADPGLGRELAARASLGDLAGLRSGFGLGPEGERLRESLVAAQGAPAPSALANFLDLAARHLREAGFEVRRLPLLAVPTALLAEREGLGHPEFLLTWNNVVVEERGGQTRAEGFSYLFPTGDEAARKTFEAVGARLDLLPPLRRSIVLNGGYRCASNHLRARR
jgi:hypothetical protein